MAVQFLVSIREKVPLYPRCVADLLTYSNKLQDVTQPNILMNINYIWRLEICVKERDLRVL